MEESTRFETIKSLDIAEMAEFMSWYMDCSGCPARKENCSDNEAMCMDALQEWLGQEGQL